jgi:valyl-tRNA synthetase
MTRSHHEFDVAPWRHASLSGWILDPGRKKMSKSKGNVVTPMGLFDQYGTDAVRYWAGSARPGVDTAYSEDQMKVGRKLANKLLNVTKFVLGVGETDETKPLAEVVTDPIDLSMLAKLDIVIAEATAGFEGFDYARALERTESFFWWFCDHYVELVKGRGYGSQDGVDDNAAHSARRALRAALGSIQRLFAPTIPFATEEAWSWWNDTSVHGADWPVATGLGGDASLINPVVDAMQHVRRAKTQAKVSQRAEVESLAISAPESVHAALVAGQSDLRDAGTTAKITILSAAELSCEVTLAT